MCRLWLPQSCDPTQPKQKHPNFCYGSDPYAPHGTLYRARAGRLGGRSIFQ
jgi:hypothetical protein